MNRTIRIRIISLFILICMMISPIAFAYEELAKGSKGDAVVELQNKLNELGYSVGTADGDFGGKTETAIMQYQQDNRLEATGIVDETTYNAIFGIIEEDIPNATIIDIWLDGSDLALSYDDGTVILLGSSNKNINGETKRVWESTIVATDVVKTIYDSGDYPIFIDAEGKAILSPLLSSGKYQLDDDWTNLSLAGAGPYHAVGLKDDGSWISAGEYRNGECNVEEWTDIVQIALGDDFTVGLKSDGTVVATGLNKYGECNVSEWTDIIKIVVGGWTTLGLKSDGTVVAAGDDRKDQCFVGRWKNVVDISACGSTSFGLTADGKILTTNDEMYKNIIPEGLTIKNAVAISGYDWGSLGDGHILIEKSDGGIELIGEMFEGEHEYFLGYIDGSKLDVAIMEAETSLMELSQKECEQIALTYMQEHIHSYLKNPASLQITSVSGSKADGSTYLFVINYTAMNSFGGYTPDTYYCQVDYTTGEVTMGGTI